MKRDIGRLRSDTFDLLVIGGGIYGVTIARAAALRGLRVALIEQGDIGHATSANSQKVIHGGLRYLQHLNLKRMRESIVTRRRLLRLAPHLLRVQPFLIPTHGHGILGKESMAIALKLNDLISWDRNRAVQESQQLPAGRILSKGETLEIMKGVVEDDLTGGALWYDCIVKNTERLTFSFLLAAVEHGACAANYVRAEKYLVSNNAIHGVQVTDLESSTALEIHAQLVVDATGPWVNRLGDNLPDVDMKIPRTGWAKAWNLVINRRIFGDYAVGLASGQPQADADAVIQKGDRYLFFVPWREGTLVGTSYELFDGAPDACKIERRDVAATLEDVNRTYPQANLSSADVTFSHTGILPCDYDAQYSHGDLNLKKQRQIVDYAMHGGPEGVVAVLGVKYTTAVSVADEVADLAMTKLGRVAEKEIPDPPLPGGERTGEADPSGQAQGIGATNRTIALDHLKGQYGSRHTVILEYARENTRHLESVSSNTTTTVAEVLHAVREEMAQTLSDVVLRRTELGTLAYPGDRAIERCADIMSHELGWDRKKKMDQIDDVMQAYELRDN